MYGAIIGDLAGSIHEYDQIKGVKSVVVDKLIEENSFFSDDTILTIAIADAIANGRDYEKYLKYYVKKYAKYRPDFEPYFKTSFSPGMIKWANGEADGKSTGNGAMMRISPIGFLFDSESDVIENARLATIPSHNSIEAIDSATKIALIIYYLRTGMSKEEVFKKLSVDLKFTPFTKFNSTCCTTIDNCLYAFYHSNSFEDAIRKTIALGGDTDTNACIVGSMAEAEYGISDELIEIANSKIPNDFVSVLSKVRRM